MQHNAKKFTIKAKPMVSDDSESSNESPKDKQNDGDKDDGEDRTSPEEPQIIEETDDQVFRKSGHQSAMTEVLEDGYKGNRESVDFDNKLKMMMNSLGEQEEMKQEKLEK